MTGQSQPTEQAWMERLIALGVKVRDAIGNSLRSGAELSRAVAHEGGDTIFEIDRHVEPAIEAEARGWPAACRPLMLIAEGMGEDGVMMIGGDADATPAWRVLIDPIDGTRNIMYDKRAAWFIAAVTPGMVDGRAPTLADSVASVIIELPTSKQGRADLFAATRSTGGAGGTGGTGGTGGGHAWREDLATGDRAVLDVRSSGATSLLNGFGQVANFFPGTKVLASDLMERIVSATLGDVQPGQASVFDDQYITTAGQMVELMVGHDRFCCDLRPLFYQALERETGRQVRGLECHPYDLAGLLVAQRFGVVMTDGLGRPLDAPLDVHAPVHWCGYANERLREQIEPVIQMWLKERGVE